MMSSILSAVALIALISTAQAVHGLPICTYPKWVPGTQYCAGEKVQHNSIQYSSLWCTTSEPRTGAQYNGWQTLGACASTPTSSPTESTSSSSLSPTGVPTPAPGSPFVIGYFPAGKVYSGFYLKNLVTSGSAPLITHIAYAFGGVNSDATCYSTDPYVDTDHVFTAANSVDGTDDTVDQPLKGNFNQILQLKRNYPHIKVLWSFGGWGQSVNFGAAAQDPQNFAESCYNLVFNETYTDADGTPVFDGIDIDWEYPNACADMDCDTSGPQGYPTLLAALRERFGSALVTSAITGDGQDGGKIDQADYAGGAAYLDFMMVMTYDYYGTWAQYGPTAPHAPLFSYDEIPNANQYADKAIQKLKSLGIPSEKLVFGVPFYGRGWTGVSQEAPGGAASGPAPGAAPGEQTYKNLKNACPHTGYVAGTSYSHCNLDWWSYDTPQTILFKAAYAADQGLGGMFTWELSGDTDDAEMLKAMAHHVRSRFRARTCSSTNNHFRA